MNGKGKRQGARIAREVILIGAGGRNAGKTALAAALIRELRGRGCPVNAAKVITVAHKGALCPRGGRGCGACSLESDFALCEERDCATGKDTALLLAAGASRVFLLRSLKEALGAAFFALRTMSGGGPLIVESNSLRTVIHPALFVMLLDEDVPPKPSAQAVMQKADMVVAAPFTEAALREILARIDRSGF